MNREANAKYIYDELTKAGMTPEGACGVLGNLEAESGLDPANLQNTYNSRFGMTDAEYVERVDNGTYRNFIRDQAGFGLAQWTYWSRKQMLLERIQSLGYGSIGSLEGQVDYLLWEMKEYYPNVWNFLKNATSVRGASNLVLMRYEQPADQSVAAQEYRTALGEKWYEKLVALSEPEPDPEPKEQENTYWPPRMIDKTMSGRVAAAGGTELPGIRLPDRRVLRREHGAEGDRLPAGQRPGRGRCRGAEDMGETEVVRSESYA